MANNSTVLNATLVRTSRCPFHVFTETEAWLQVSSFLLIVVFSIFGNTVVIIIIKKNRQMHRPTNYFIANLCFANLMIMFLNVSPDILGRIAPHLGFAVSGKCTFISFAFGSYCSIVNSLSPVILTAAKTCKLIFSNHIEG